MKAVAYMLDKDAWKVFAGECAEYAVGGPTVEIFINSYKQMHPESQLEYQVADVGTSYKAENGYTYRNGSSGSWSSNVSSAFSKSDPLYVITDTSKACGMWLASPSSYNANYLNYVYNSERPLERLLELRQQLSRR